MGCVCRLAFLLLLTRFSPEVFGWDGPNDSAKDDSSLYYLTEGLEEFDFVLRYVLHQLLIGVNFCKLGKFVKLIL